MPALSVAQAFGAGARAAGRSAWLTAPALVVAMLRSGLTWAAPLTALGIARSGAAAGHGASSAVAGTLLALTAPRTIAILAGLFLAAHLLSGAMRVAWLAGALPVLGAHLAGAPPERRFAAGLAYGFAPLLGTALLALVVEAVAQALGLAWVVGALTISARRFGGGDPVLPALLVAGACVVAVLSLFAAPMVGDAALARAALAGERPARALWRAARGFARRPAAYLALALALAVASVATVGSVQIASSAALGATRGAPALVVVGSQLMASVLGTLLGALLELWRLGAIASLACGDPDDGPA